MAHQFLSEELDELMLEVFFELVLMVFVFLGEIFYFFQEFLALMLPAYHLM
jgi:hypothetical protein